MRGRPGCPTGQKKNSVGATGGRTPFFYKERLGTKSPPHPPQCAHWGTFPPRGRLWAWVRPFPTTTPTFPSPPSRGAGRYGRWIMGRRPGKKEGGPPQGPPKPEKVGPGRKNLFLPGVLSSGFLQRKPGSPAGVGGGNHVAGPTLRRSRRPQTWPPPGRRPTGRCAPRPVKAPPTWRVPIISPVAFLSRAPQNTARPPPAGWPPGQSTPRPPRLGGSSRPSPARGRRR